jgi:hypothetical protein
MIGHNMASLFGDVRLSKVLKYYVKRETWRVREITCGNGWAVLFTKRTLILIVGKQIKSDRFKPKQQAFTSRQSEACCKLK